MKCNKRKKHVKKIQLIYVLHFRQYKIDDHDQYVLIKNQKQREQFKQSIISNQLKNKINNNDLKN